MDGGSKGMFKKKFRESQNLKDFGKTSGTVPFIQMEKSLLKLSFQVIIQPL